MYRQTEIRSSKGQTKGMSEEDWKYRQIKKVIYCQLGMYVTSCHMEMLRNMTAVFHLISQQNAV